MLDASGGACYPSPVANGVRYDLISEREIVSGRALAAVAYLPGLCFIGLLEAPRNRFVRFHARQGLALFLCEIVAWLAIAVVDASLGRIPVLGLIAGASLRLMLGMGFLAATVYGAAKGLSGETVRIPFLGDLPDKLRL
jgi:uncharacterized membrane protein